MFRRDNDVRDSSVLERREKEPPGVGRMYHTFLGDER